MKLGVKKIIFGVFFISSICFSQTTSSVLSSKTGVQMEAFNSPSAQGFRTFGNFPPSNFIGVTDITIPIYNIDYRNNSIPINLRYHNGMGNIVNSVPGSLGLGWHLTSGGTITLVESKKSDALDGVLTEVGFNIVNPPNWYTQEYLKTLIKDVNNPNRGVSVSNFYDESLQKNVYSFNFNGYSGEIYFDHNDLPQIRSKEGHYFDIKFEFVPDVDPDPNPDKVPGFWVKLPTMTPYYNIDVIRKTYFYINLNPDKIKNMGYINLKNKTVYKFKLIDKEGVEYVFGGDKNAIEFSRLGHSGLQSDYSTTNFKIYPLTWHLTEIKYPNGEKIKYSYNRGEVLYQSITETNVSVAGITKIGRGWTDNFMSTYLYGNSVQGTLINPVYLEHIETPKEDIYFSYSKSKQLETHLKDFVGFNNCVYYPDTKLVKCDFSGQSEKWLAKRNFFFYYENDIRYTDFTKFKQLPEQLDVIRVVRKNKEIFKEILFNYTQNYNERLKLLSVSVKSIDPSLQAERYNFEYDMTSRLPIYDSYEVDNQGFYNGNSGFGYSDSSLEAEHKGGILQEFKNSDSRRENYIKLRESNLRFKTSEMLTAIKYPTGGSTKFEYESNMYGKIAKNYPFIVVDNNNFEEKLTGGVRIKSIKSYDSNSVLLTAKSYKYVKDFYKGESKSSGILTHEPTYFDAIKAKQLYEGEKVVGKNYEYNTDVDKVDYFNWSTSDIYPANRLRGNHITYSEVTEVDDLDGSFITYKYKNFDNGFHDQPILSWIANHDGILKDEKDNNKDLWKKWDVISMDLERGQLLSKTYFKPIENISGKRGDKIKEFKYLYNDDSNRFNNHIRVINRYNNKLYSPYTRDLMSWTYIASKIYTYTPYLKREIEIDYNGNDSIIKKDVSYKYNDTYKVLTEKEEHIGGTVYKTTYKYPFDFTNRLDGVYNKMVSKHMISPVIFEEKYLNTEKILSQKTNYKKHYPIVFGGIKPGLPLMEEQNNMIDFPILELPYSPVIGIVESQYKGGNWEKEIEFLEYDSKLNPLNYKDKLGKETSYIWGYNESLPVWVISNVPYSVVKSVLGDKIYKIANATTPSTEDLLAVNKLLKESPELKDAFIEHYLYDPMRGLIYKEDITGVKEYYQYDGLGRLKKVQDSKKNTVIEYEYNYKQSPFVIGK